MEEAIKFPKDFLWGSATSAYQVEGGIGNNDWARVYPAGQACDHYHLYENDFDLLKELNQNVYRFSIEWSRIEPEESVFNEKEIEHYRNVLKALKARNIKAVVTLFHFSLPLWMANLGGFENQESVFYFSRFAERMLDEYKDLVDFWITINEPAIYASVSYIEGRWPPKKKNLLSFLKVIKNQISSHKKIFSLFHQKQKSARVGIAQNNAYFEPFNSGSFPDKISSKIFRYLWNQCLLDRIKNQLDFIGLNYYFHNKIGFPAKIMSGNKVVSDLGWEIFPAGIYHTIIELKKYKLPIYITENGVADAKDKLRRDFVKDHLYWTWRAISDGADVRGYFHWSLIDNFEWEKGFGPRFGLVEVDYQTMERRVRPSGYYYSQVCRNNQLPINNLKSTI